MLEACGTIGPHADRIECCYCSTVSAYPQDAKTRSIRSIAKRAVALKGELSVLSFSVVSLSLLAFLKLEEYNTVTVLCRSRGCAPRKRGPKNASSARPWIARKLYSLVSITGSALVVRTQVLQGAAALPASGLSRVTLLS